MSYIEAFCSNRPALGYTIGSLELQEIQTQGNSLSLTAWLTYTLTATSPSLDSRSSVIAVPIVSVSVFPFLICACLYCFGVALTRDAKTGSCRIASVPCAMFLAPFFRHLLPLLLPSSLPVLGCMQMAKASNASCRRGFGRSSSPAL